jgi:hypothetical protein
MKRSLVIAVGVLVAAKMAAAQPVERPAPAPAGSSNVSIGHVAETAPKVREVTVLSRGAPRKIATTTPIAQVSSDALIAGRDEAMPAPETKANGNIRQALPYRFQPAAELASPTAAAAPALPLRAVYELEAGGLGPLDTGGYEGAILLGLVNEHEPNAKDALPQPVVFELIGTEGAEISPRAISITHLNIPYEESKIRASEYRPEIAIKLKTDYDDNYVNVSVPMRRPVLVLTPSPSAIPGFGLGTSTIDVSASRAWSKGLTAVGLSATKGILSDTRVSLKDGMGQVTLRSSSLGVSHIAVTGSDVEAHPIDVRYQWPVAFVIAAIAGGAIGGILRKPPRRTRSSAALIGAMTGIVFAVAGVLGVNLLEIKIDPHAGEAAVFLFAALGNLVGSKAIQAVKEAKSPPT